MTIDTKTIRAAAEAAPKDMLHIRHDFGVYYSLRHYPGDYYQGRVRGKERANFIATANPATVIALLDRLEAAEKDAARYRAIAADPYFDGYAWWTQDICIIESDDQSKPPTKAQVDEAIDAAMKAQK